MFMALKMTTNLKILSKFLVLLKMEAASHGLASFEQASYIAKWCNKNNFEISGGSKIGYRLGLLPCQIHYICYYIKQLSERSTSKQVLPWIRKAFIEIVKLR